ncbi:MAG: DegT/DnrJ/EryC1/StrS family aminotransferase [Candidatus Binatia bacterium]
MRATMLAFARPQLGVEEEQAVVEVLRSGWIGTGPRSERFEREFAAYVGAADAVAVSSCTAGLYLTLRALGIGPGDEVITSPLTFPSTANAVLQLGARPVFADVLPDLLTLDPAAVRAAVTPRTRAIIAVHLAGWPCEMNGLGAVAAARDLLLIEDAAHAIGATYRGRAAGALGDAAVFSFYATKNITTGEGGMITTDRADCLAQLRRERLHGIDLDASQRIGADYRHWEAVSMGWKFNLTDLSAALGLAQLAKLPGFLTRRRALDRRYRERLADLAGVRVQTGPAEAVTSAHLFPILLVPGALRIDRDAMLQALLAENIGVGVHFRSLPLHRFFREEVGARPEDTPRATDASARILSLPLYPGMTEADQDDVLEAVTRIVEYYRA